MFFQVVKAKGLEGIVAKHSQSAYLLGGRSRQWLKIKTQLTQEGVIAGFTEPRGGRKYFGSLVLGVCRGRVDLHRPFGRGIRSGKSKENPCQIAASDPEPECPFKVEPPAATPVTWVRPELVCEVTFAGWTEDGLLRHPVFSRLREDKSAREVGRETPSEIQASRAEEQP